MKFKFVLVFFLTCASTENVRKKAYSKPDDTAKYLVQGFYSSLPLVQRMFAFITDPNYDGKGFQMLLKLAENIVRALLPPQEVPSDLPQDIWWGEYNNHSQGTRIRPFKVQFSNELVNDIRGCIHNRRNFTPTMKNAFNTYGTNTEYLTEVLDYWERKYDFKSREKHLNRFPQFVTNIQGLDIHYVHIKPNVTKKVLPILLLHGSPLTLFEYGSLIDNLMKPRTDKDFVFEIIAPDLPGFGYSQATNKIGLGGYQIGIIMKNLMKRLGFQKFYIQSGDVGQWVGSSMAIMYPNDIFGLHTNLPFSFMPQTLAKYFLGQLYPAAVVEPQYEERMYPISNQLKFFFDNGGYLHEHITRPDTVGIALEQSPVSLAAWLLPLFMVGGHGREENNQLKDGNLKNNYHMDDIIDSFTIYWDQQCMTTSARLYAEQAAYNQDPINMIITGAPTKVPYAALKFRHEIVYQPDSFLKDKYPNLLQSITLNYGGHFAGFENSKDIAESIWLAIPKMEKFNLKHKKRLQT